ncbi:hypothetical protein [Pedobacter sp. Hv1]|uniref:hypothetical protein n=1 Tax=Pedobacter sp. Hv1 TaxID=1740090 RepID=UPI0006D8986F|nr:hypothetical protein [Pedobacter sp. Hv1]KQC01462.1 hypothetical protein AQF98_07075 [Pedobacter sp. Hv1]
MANIPALLSINCPKFEMVPNFRSLVHPKNGKCILSLKHGFMVTDEISSTRQVTIGTRIYISAGQGLNKDLLFSQHQEFGFSDLRNNDDGFRAIEQIVYRSYDEALRYMKRTVPFVYKNRNLALLDVYSLSRNISVLLSKLN